MLARRCTVPVALDLAVDRRLPETAEVAAYYIVSEALTNVAKHAQAAEVTVSARLTDRGLELTITDDGEGVPEAVRPVLFEPFHRGPQRHPEASGLGLAIARKSVEDHDGTITVESMPGHGTTFTVELPITERMKDEG